MTSIPVKTSVSIANGTVRFYSMRVASHATHSADVHNAITATAKSNPFSVQSGFGAWLPPSQHSEKVRAILKSVFDPKQKFSTRGRKKIVWDTCDKFSETSFCPTQSYLEIIAMTKIKGNYIQS